MADAIRLHRSRHRLATGLTLIEGPHLFEEAVAAGSPLERVFCLSGDGATRDRAAALQLEPVLVAEEILHRLATTPQPQSPVAVVPIPPPRVPDRGHLVVAWGIADPGNVGTLVRTAAAFGMGFVAGPETADPWSPKVLRAGAGAHFHTTVGRVAAHDDLRALERHLVATVVAGGDNPSEVDFPADAALLVGSEAEGLPGWLVEAADRRVTIAMPGGTESLNASVAGAIVAYEMTMASRSRGDGPFPARD